MHVYAQVCGLPAGCFAAAGALPVAGAPACYLLAHSALQVTTCLAHLCVCSGAGLLSPEACPKLRCHSDNTGCSSRAAACDLIPHVHVCVSMPVSVCL